MARMVRVLATVTLAGAMVACSGGDGGGGSAGRPHRTSTSSTPGSTSTSAGAVGPAGVLAARIELSTRRVAAGGSIDATVVVTNRTGRPVTAIGCGSLFGVSLTNDSVPPNTNQLACRQEFTIPVGTTRYPVLVRAEYPFCTSTPQPGYPSCEPGTGAAPLPPGRYRTALNQPGPVVPAPAPVAVVVT